MSLTPEQEAGVKRWLAFYSERLEADEIRPHVREMMALMSIGLHLPYEEARETVTRMLRDLHIGSAT